MSRPFTLALPGGRMQAPALEFLTRAGWPTQGCFAEGRDLLAEPRPGLRLLLVRPADVGVYVASGAADAGITGHDMLLEHTPAVVELADLGFGRCRVVLATPPAWRERLHDRWAGDGAGPGGLRVASKYPRLAARLLAERGYAAEVVALAGHVELAPRAGLADAVVDLVDTGRTLAANGLVVVEELAVTTARLVANPVAFRLRRQQFEPLLGTAGGRRWTDACAS